MAFSLATYKDARPWAKAIGEEVLQRRMPPWGAVKGFGDFRNDQGLTAEQLELIVDWEEGGAPEGEEKDMPGSAETRQVSRSTDKAAHARERDHGRAATGRFAPHSPSMDCCRRPFPTVRRFRSPPNYPMAAWSRCSG